MFVRVFKAVLLLTTIGIIAACSPNTGNTPNAANAGNAPSQALAQVAPTATPIPTAPAVAKPTYLVQRGDVQNILDFTDVGSHATNWRSHLRLREPCGV